MQSDVAHYADVIVLRVSGRIHQDTGAAFQEMLLGAITGMTPGKSAFVVDLGGVSYISSAGLHALMAGAKECGKKGIELNLASLQPMVREVLQISRFDVLMTIFGDTGAALASLSPAAKKVYDEGLGA